MKTHRTTFRTRIARFGLSTLAAAVAAISLVGAASAGSFEARQAESETPNERVSVIKIPKYSDRTSPYPW
jgi:hypothetical protein